MLSMVLQKFIGRACHLAHVRSMFVCPINTANAIAMHKYRAFIWLLCTLGILAVVDLTGTRQLATDLAVSKGGRCRSALNSSSPQVSIAESLQARYCSTGSA
jgi:hypothetical protein